MNGRFDIGACLGLRLTLMCYPRAGQRLMGDSCLADAGIPYVSNQGLLSIALGHPEDWTREARRGTNAYGAVRKRVTA